MTLPSESAMPNWRTDDAQGLTDEDTPIDPLTCPARTKLTNNIRKRTKRVVVNQNKRTSNAQELLRGKTKRNQEAREGRMSQLDARHNFLLDHVATRLNVPIDESVIHENQILEKLLKENTELQYKLYEKDEFLRQHREVEIKRDKEVASERSNTRCLLEHLEQLVSRHERSLRSTVVKRHIAQNAVSSEVELLKVLRSLVDHHETLERVEDMLKVQVARTKELEMNLYNFIGSTNQLKKKRTIFSKTLAQSKRSKRNLKKSLTPDLSFNSPLGHNTFKWCNSDQVPQITPYVQGGPRNPLFQNSNILTAPNQPNLPQYTTSAPLPESTPPYGYSRSQLPYAPRTAPPPPPTELPFDHSHEPVIRHVSEPSSRDDKVISPLPYDADSSPVSKPEVELIKRHHVPPAHTYTREMMRGGKFEVTLVWRKQQPTLETTLEYLDMKDTSLVLLNWKYKKEAFIASARLSPGEHRGSLAIPDSDAVVYEVQPFNVSQFSVSVQEIKLDLVEIAPKYRNVTYAPKGPVYSQIDLTSKRLSANLRRDDQTQFLGERNEAPYFQNDRDKVVAPPVKYLRDKCVAKLPIELERPLTPPKAEKKVIMTDQNIIHSILQDTTDIISAQQSQVSEHYTTPPESSDDMHRQVSEEDDLLPLRKKTRTNVHLFPDNQSTNENMIELTSVNKNRSPPRKRKNLAQLNFKMQDQTSSAVDTDTSNPQLSETEPFKTMNGFKVLRKCFIKYQPKKEVTYTSPLVP